jgi:hypothetical protein
MDLLKKLFGFDSKNNNSSKIQSVDKTVEKDAVVYEENAGKLTKRKEGDNIILNIKI